MNIQSNSDKNSNSSFFKLPEFLFSDNRYNHISNDAKMLYALLNSRKGLSAVNGWKNKNGIFIIFTREEMAQKLHCGMSKIRTTVNELKLVGLLHETRQGLNKPNLIYVLDPLESENNMSVPTIKSPANKGQVKTNAQDRCQSNVNKSEIDYIIDDDIRKKVIDQINADEIAESSEIVETICDTIHTIYCSQQPCLINRVSIQADQMKRRFEKLRKKHVQQVINRFKQSHTVVMNTFAYFSTALYNSINTSEHLIREKNSVCQRSVIHYQNERMYQADDLLQLIDDLDNVS